MNRCNIILLAAVACAAAQSPAQQLILDGQAIDLSSPYIICNNDPLTAAELALGCRTTGDVVVDSAVGDLTCANVTTPPNVSIVASPTSLTGPGSVTVSWITQFADSCTPSGGGATNWSSTNITPLASGQTTITNVGATTTFTLSCDNVLGTSADSATVTVSGNDEYGGFPPPSDCGLGQPPPVGTSHENPLEVVAGPSGRLGVSNNFEGPFGEGWPGINNSGEDIYVGRHNWLAMGFLAGQAASCTGTGCSRTSGLVEWGTSILPDGSKVVSISRCPGDFSTALGDCRSDRSPISWSYSTGNNCVLTLGQQYYLNVIHGTSADPSVSTCSVNECGAFLSVR